MAQILFVDDDMATLQLMKTALEVMGHEALLSSTADEAIFLALQHKPIVILIDRHLMEIDGCSLISRLRLLHGIHQAQMYLVSAMITDEDIRCADSAGAQGCFEKPLDFKRLSMILTSTVF
jgi:CheY-like chemotaxis protein